ncbi:MAG: hypothetical protein B7Y45_11030 [Sphingomonas sp. 28-66-16]|nr:MAG: hypothetical protein B7Y45_11030 [Sphingomonas sp. 28-66-16]
MQSISFRQALIATLLTIMAGGASLAVLALLGPDWQAYPQATCTATHCFCEMPRIGALIVQPANSWSSMGFVLIGCLIILLARDRGWRSAMPPVAAQVFGITAIFVGLGSLLLHATLTLWGQFFDVMGMYLVGAFMLVSALARWRRIPDRLAIILYLLLCAALIGVLIAMPDVRRWLFAVVLLVAIIVELGFARSLRPGAMLRYYLLGMLVQAIAFGIWILDQSGTVCSPRSLFQGHAVWHLLGAVALGMSFLYYRSERSA